MIRHSFLFLKKIGKRRELQLWEQGILDWQDFLQAKAVKGISPNKKNYYHRQLQAAQQALLQENSSYFLEKLPSTEVWRLYPHFKDDSCFLDIEIDSRGRISVVGISNYYSTNHFVQGVNLEKGWLEKELHKYKLIITFNGGSFDLPKLKKQFHLEIKIPHLDLKPLCQRLGLQGGLKKIEEELNLKRPQHLRGNPVDLWKAFHASGDREYLELLLEYNSEDIENLKAITEFVYKELVKALRSPS